MAKQRIVTLLTDFGRSGPYVAEMTGVIMSITPGATVVDITHDIPPGDILAGAFVLRQAFGYFPPDTVHCVVVDPTVGTDRRIMAARYAGQTIVFPDNGVIGLVERDYPLEQIVAIRNEQYFLESTTSATFHGRDIIAPVAAYLSGGLPMDRLGPAPGKFKLLDIPEPAEEPDGLIRGQIIYVDHFGNLISDVSAQLLHQVWGEPVGVVVFCAGNNIGVLKATYAFAAPGAPLSLINSMSLVEVAVNGGRACDILDAGVGAEVRLVRSR